MRIIALMNQKGGVGKTTTTVNLGAAIAELGKRVCLIDLDPQAHLTINYGIEPSDDHPSLYDMLIEDKSFLEAVRKVDERIALVPSSIDLAAAEIELVSVLGRETLLKKRLEAAQHDFDYILLDCPPSLGLLTINALAVASEVIVPMQAHFLALQGVAKLLETVQLVSKRMNPGLKVTGIVLTMYDAQTKLTSEVVAELNGFIEQAKGKQMPWSGAKVFATKIRRNIKLAESPSFGETILEYDPASNGAMDYRALAREVMGLPPAPPVVAKTQTGGVAARAVPTQPVTAIPVSARPAVAPPVVPKVAVQFGAPGIPKVPLTAPPVVRPAAAAPVPFPAAVPVAKTQATQAPGRAVAPAAVRPAAPAAPKAILRPPGPVTPPVVRAPIHPPTGSRPAPGAPVSTPAPIPAPAPPPAKPAVQVTVNPAIDQTKLAASNKEEKSSSPDAEAAA